MCVRGCVPSELSEEGHRANAELILERVQGIGQSTSKLINMALVRAKGAVGQCASSCSIAVESLRASCPNPLRRWRLGACVVLRGLQPFFLTSAVH